MFNYWHIEKRKSIWERFIWVCLAYVVGMFICFFPTLWGIFTLWGWHCGDVKKVPHNVGFDKKKSPQCRFFQRKKKFPTVFNRKFGCKILHCGELIFTNYHQTFHGRDENLQCGELCKHSYFIMIYLHLFWIVTPDVILHCEEDISNQWDWRKLPHNVGFFRKFLYPT